MITILRQLRISQNPRGDRELAIAAERMKEQGPVTVRRYRRQAHAEDPFLPPLEIQAADVVIGGQRVRHEVAVRYTPGRVPLPRVHDQAVAELVGHVGECVVAAATAQINGDVGDKGVLRAR